jgi:hypothetical protein
VTKPIQIAHAIETGKRNHHRRACAYAQRPAIDQVGSNIKHMFLMEFRLTFIQIYLNLSIYRNATSENGRQRAIFGASEAWHNVVIIIILIYDDHHHNNDNHDDHHKNGQIQENI